MPKLSDKILQKIKEEKIVPKPRWQFFLKNYFIWLLFLVSLILGALAFCAMLNTFFTNDWDIYRYLQTSLVGHILISLPYIWIVFLIFFVWIAYQNFKYTKSGYRRETFFVVGLSVIGSFILGAFLHTLGAGEMIEDSIASSVPFYEKIACCSARKDIWDQPEKGLLAGEIKTIMDKNEFELEDFKGEVWQIERGEKMLVPSGLLIIAGRRVKLIGEKRGELRFWAKEIRAWGKSER